MPTPVKVKQWGGSMAVLIPAKFAEMREIRTGMELDLDPVQIISAKRRRYRLAELMADYREEHRHGETDLGDPVGREIW